MPIVKSIAIHDNVRATLRYILNPEKTEDMFWCNSYNCMTNAEDAYLNMKFIYEDFTHHKSISNKKRSAEALLSYYQLQS